MMEKDRLKAVFLLIPEPIFLPMWKEVASSILEW
jgi:hypothetical protein